MKLVDGKWTLFGIVSWGYLCGADEHAGLYTKVINYVNDLHGIIENIDYITDGRSFRWS